MTERARQVYALLRTLLAWAPGPLYRAPSAPAGFQHGRRDLTCEDCLANGRPMPGCEMCGGSGVVVFHGRDPMANTTRQVARVMDDEKQAARDQAAARDRAIERVDQLLAQHAGAEAEHDALTFAVEKRDRMYQAGDYAELEKQLGWLRAIYPEAYHVAMCVAYAPFGEEPVEPLRPFVRAVCELLAQRMPSRIRVPSFVPVFTVEELERQAREGRDALHRGRSAWHDAKRAERRALVVGMYADGLSVGAIAGRLRVHRRTVQRMLEEARKTVATGPAA